jgi:5'(3')-deoxyribonucleotidase
LISQICLDVDGVLADFTRAALPLFGKDPDEFVRNWPPGCYYLSEALGLSVREFWAPIDRAGWRFWADIPALPEARDLFALCQRTAPTVIVTTPSLHTSSVGGKVTWLQKMFGRGFRDYFVGARKEFCARPGSVLIDDFEDNCRTFSNAGGRSILFPQPWNSAHGAPEAADRLRYVKWNLEKQQEWQ